MSDPYLSAKFLSDDRFRQEAIRKALMDPNYVGPYSWMERPRPSIMARWLPDYADWCRAWELPIVNGKVKLYKAIGPSFKTGAAWNKKVVWRIGAEVTCDDWDPRPKCGGGLHLGPTIREADNYRHFGPTFYLQVEVNLTDIVPIPMTDRPNRESIYGAQFLRREQVDKCKVRSCRVISRVDAFGTPIFLDPDPMMAEQPA